MNTLFEKRYEVIKEEMVKCISSNKRTKENYQINEGIDKEINKWKDKGCK